MVRPRVLGRARRRRLLHRLAVRRRYAGIGQATIEWAQQQVVAHRRAYLCLDCLSSNARLRRYYEDLGFHRVGEINGPLDHPHSAAHGAWRATLYENMVGRA
ncbi:MAG: N-acetyltransferase [Acidimicrobiales bacterium]